MSSLHCIRIMSEVEIFTACHISAGYFTVFIGITSTAVAATSFCIFLWRVLSPSTATNAFVRRQTVIVRHTHGTYASIKLYIFSVSRRRSSIPFFAHFIALILNECRIPATKNLGVDIFFATASNKRMFAVCAEHMHLRTMQNDSDKTSKKKKMFVILNALMKFVLCVHCICECMRFCHIHTAIKSSEKYTYLLLKEHYERKTTATTREKKKNIKNTRRKCFDPASCTTLMHEHYCV